MNENVVDGVIEEVVKDLVADVTMFMEIQDDEEPPVAKRQRVDDGTNGSGYSVNVFGGPSRSTYPQERKKPPPSPLARRGPAAVRNEPEDEDRPGALLSSYVPQPGHIAMVHPLHNLIIEVPEDIPILLQGPAIPEGSGRGEMQDPERLQRIENFKARIARQLEYVREQATAYELRSEEENEAGPSGQ